MKKYLKHTSRIAKATPEHRNRVVDFWRAAAIVAVVFGHWLAASIWLTPDGRGHVQLMNSLEWVPFAGYVTWIVQVMPIFFFAGGYANARSLGDVHSGVETRGAWVTARIRRLFTPALPLLVVWTGLIVVLSQVLEPGIVRAGAMSATLPLWFLAVYMLLISLAPLTHAWWRRNGMASILILLGGAVAVDVTRFVFGVGWSGWINFLFVWAAVHQMGYLWADADKRGGVSVRTGGIVTAGSLAMLVALTSTGLYPVAMLGIPGAGVTNMTPPTSAMAILGTMQLGLVWATRPLVNRITTSLRGWHAVVSVSGVIMTLYLWHMTAMSLVAAVGLNWFDGALFRIEPGTPWWWLSRPLWLALLATVAAALTAAFARFEWSINTDPAPRRTTAVLTGIGLILGSTAAVALDGLADQQAMVEWRIPVAAILGAALVGAFPRLGSHDTAAKETRDPATR